MNLKLKCLAAGLFAANFLCAELAANEISNVFIVSKDVEFKYVKRVTVSIGGEVALFVLPGIGARKESFAMDTEMWGNAKIINFLLDARGQVPAIAYYGYHGKDVCLIGEFSRLIFEKESNLVIEPLHSSASEKVINRYDFRGCSLNIHDQLMDKAIGIESFNGGSFKRVVTKLKGVHSKKFRCEYAVEHGASVDPDNCFRR